MSMYVDARYVHMLVAAPALTVDQIALGREWAKYDADTDLEPNCDICGDRGEVRQETADCTYWIDCMDCELGGMR